MKKLLFILTLLFAISTQAQYFMYGFNNVPDDEIEHYLQNEKELFSQAAQKAFEKGVINGWAIMRRHQGAKSEPNFYWYIGVDNLEKLDALGKDFGLIVQNTVNASGVPSLVRRALKNHNGYTRFVATYYRPEVMIKKNSEGFIYFKHNVALSPNPNQWLQTQIDQWGPFIKKNMNNGKIKQEIWAPAVRLNPVGNGYNWNVISVDGYRTLEELHSNGGSSFPDMSSVDFDAIQATMPNGWYKQVIWERVLWLDNDGKLMQR